MKRLIFALTLTALFLNASCEPSSPPAPVAEPSLTRAESTPVSTRTPLPSRTPVPLVAQCSPLSTPQPTRTPGAPIWPTTVLAAQWPVPTGSSQLAEIHLHSNVVNRDLSGAVYLPPGYFDSTRRYPVLYILSGFSGDYHEWISMGMCDVLEILTRVGKIQPMIVVFPDGSKSWWFNHAPPPGGDGQRWGDYVWQDVVGFIDSHYRTLAQPQSRAIGGLSAGGQSALMFGFTHPEVFSTVGAHSPSLRGADGSVPDFGTWDYFNQYDPLWLVENKTVPALNLWIDVAANDDNWRNCNPPPAPQRCIQVFHDELNERGIPHDWHADWPGVHDDYYWAEHIADYLAWYSSKLAGQTVR